LLLQGEPIEEVGKESAVSDVEMSVLNEDVGPADKNVCENQLEKFVSFYRKQQLREVNRIC
jgi:hypothetical protein